MTENCFHNFNIILSSFNIKRVNSIYGDAQYDGQITNIDTLTNEQTKKLTKRPTDRTPNRKNERKINQANERPHKQTNKTTAVCWCVDLLDSWSVDLLMCWFVVMAARSPLEFHRILEYLQAARPNKQQTSKSTNQQTKLVRWFAGVIDSLFFCLLLVCSCVGLLV